MKTSVKQFWGAFFVTLIVIAGACGLMLVDYSTNRYMPGRFGALLSISPPTADGLDFAVMGREYHIDAEPVRQGIARLAPYADLLPADLRLGGQLGGAAFALLRERADEAREAPAPEA